eukprot:TRINITY_DN1436_c1_g1_i1.p1 TRINITY_DN1436_c1_g1~~TRINITY_DN1436_c1_g1_i1.p1  ORF type:complete len:383 (-),score=56.96 TRINITY_DN1436_c1_g1_i1:709-1857(-)
MRGAAAAPLALVARRSARAKWSFGHLLVRPFSSSQVQSTSGKLVLKEKPGCCLREGVKEKLQAAFSLGGPDSLSDFRLQMRDISTRSYRYEIPVLARILSDRTEEFYRFHSCVVKDFWQGRSLLMKSYTFVETLPGFPSGSFSSCLYCLGRKDSEKGWGHKGRSHLGTPGGKSSKRVWTNALLAINVIAYVGQIATDGKLMSWGAKINSLIDEGELWRLVTSSFLHADIAHLLVNCYSLNAVGPTVEKISGPKRFLTVYFTSAIASSTLSYYLCNGPSVGASGAIFGLVGSFAMFLLRHRDLVPGAKDKMQNVAHVLGINMVFGLLSNDIDNWGHLGGLVGGATISWFVGPAWRCVNQIGDRKSIVDRAPVFRLLNWKRRKQ